MKFKVEKRTVSRTGVENLGWLIGRGFSSRKVTVKKDVWCVVNNAGIVCECRSKTAADTIVMALNGESK